MMLSRLLDWRLRRARENSGLPDLPEVRRYMRLSWCNGFSPFGIPARKLAGARQGALKTLQAEWDKPLSEQPCWCDYCCGRAGVHGAQAVAEYQAVVDALRRESKG